MTRDAVASLSGSQAINRAVLGEWLDAEDTAINALLLLFYESIDNELVRMRDLLALEDLGQFASSAHRLRGAALSMGARSLGDFTGVLFTAALAKDLNACVNGMTELGTLVKRVEAEIPGCPHSART
jgi:HPt (histidine-containing phosphotransfer) domain-containing protein